MADACASSSRSWRRARTASCACTFIDPQPVFAGRRPRFRVGVRGTPLGGSGGTLYFGLAGTNSTDGHAAIEFLIRPRRFPRIPMWSRLIYQLANPKKPVLGWLTSLPMTPSMDPQSGPDARALGHLLRRPQQLFDVRPIDPAATKIDARHRRARARAPEEACARNLVCHRPVRIKGGHIALFVDPIAEPDTAGVDPQNPCRQ